MHRSLALLPIAFLAACSAPVQENGAEPASAPLEIVTADIALGKLVATVHSGPRSISFELRLGPRMQNLPTDPDLPSYEVDARVLDGDGRVFYMQLGGDVFLDPSWRMPRVDGFDEAGRAADLAIAADADSLFARASVPEGLEQLRLAAIQIARGHRAVDEKPAPTVAITDAPPLGQKADIVWASGSAVKWDYRIRNKCLFGCTGNHTAVHLRAWSSSSAVVANFQSCNHGSCALYGDMGTHCVMAGYRWDDGSHSRYFYSDPSMSTGNTYGGCRTEYQWDSSSLWKAHNCNDDSKLQRDAIYRDSWMDTKGNSCNDLGLNNWSPGCH